MSYTPTEWKSGDVVTSAKLNKLEQAVAAGGVLLVTETVDGDVHSLDKNYSEIYAAVNAGKLCIIVSGGADPEIGIADGLSIAYVSGVCELTPERAEEDESTARYTVDTLSGQSYGSDTATGTLTYTDSGWDDGGGK